jgi:hypothetical protein
MRRAFDLDVRLARVAWDAPACPPDAGWRKEYFVHWPYVRGLVAHNSIYNWGRQQETWLDR